MHLTEGLAMNGLEGLQSTEGGYCRSAAQRRSKEGLTPWFIEELLLWRWL
jgi:hypothetical protein